MRNNKIPVRTFLRRNREEHKQVKPEAFEGFSRRLESPLHEYITQTRCLFVLDEIARFIEDVLRTNGPIKNKLNKHIQGRRQEIIKTPLGKIQQWVRVHFFAIRWDDE